MHPNQRTGTVQQKRIRHHAASSNLIRTNPQQAHLVSHWVLQNRVMIHQPREKDHGDELGTVSARLEPF